jgi:hypothetical protein
MPSDDPLQMVLPEFAVAIWLRPHRAHGYFAKVDAADVEDGLPGGVLQSFQHVGAHQRIPEFQHDRQFREFHVGRERVRQLLGLADRISYSFAERAHTPMLSGSSFGLRVTRGFEEATIVWYGKFEDQDAGICEMFALVQSLAEA